MRSHLFKSAQIPFLLRDLRYIYERSVGVGIENWAVRYAGDHSFYLYQLVSATIHFQQQA
ncbi:hypothetical protein [Pseudomonas koreensis]|uniref:hypothetical protein n=1 Tax=Pseudomonas koreensis TaxID=198620 RepID=UPI0038098A3E